MSSSLEFISGDRSRVQLLLIVLSLSLYHICIPHIHILYTNIYIYTPVFGVYAIITHCPPLEKGINTWLHSTLDSRLLLVGARVQRMFFNQTSFFDMNVVLGLLYKLKSSQVHPLLILMLKPWVEVSCSATRSNIPLQIDSCLRMYLGPAEYAAMEARPSTTGHTTDMKTGCCTSSHPPKFSDFVGRAGSVRHEKPLEAQRSVPKQRLKESRRRPDT